MPPRNSPTARNRPSDEIDLHGLTVDEALIRLDAFIHAGFRAGFYQLRIVHGKGSGILRREVDRYLADHPLVRSHRLADRFHGGEGATEVQLSDR